MSDPDDKSQEDTGQKDTGQKDKGGFWRRPRSKWLLGIPLGGFVFFFAGMVALGTTNWIVHQTSADEFCNGCHSHEMFIQPEWEASSHFSNASGVRAGCADCHVPHPWFEKMYLKITVSADIIPELMGKISTKEKYEAHRGEMAQAVWREFKHNDSQFCRHCHTFDAMELESQGRLARRRHERAPERGQTCIECHQGIVHALPENYDEVWAEVAEEFASTASTKKASGDERLASAED